MTPDEYGERIIANTHGANKDKYFISQAYAALADSVEQHNSSTPIVGNAKSSSLPEPFVVLHDFDSKTISKFDADDGIDSFQNSALAENHHHVLFMRGYPSPKWLEVIGAKYMVDSELFQRHLYFPSLAADARDQRAYPSSLSTKTDTFDLCITTIVSKEIGSSSDGPEDVEDLRRTALESSEKHQKGLKTTGRATDTVIRKHSILTGQMSVIEQTVSIQVKSVGEGWHAIVWLDQSRSLNYTLMEASKNAKSWDTYYYPTIQYSPYIALRDPAEASTTQLDPEIFQNAGLPSQSLYRLPFIYGQSLPLDAKHSNPFSALHEVFKLAASSENQFLNLMNEKIKHETKFDNTDRNVNHTCSIANLQYFKLLLDTHHQKLNDNMATLEAVTFSNLPAGAASPMHESEARDMRLLKLDFSYLRTRAEELSRSCQDGIKITKSWVAVQEEQPARTTGLARWLMYPLRLL